MKAVLYTIVEPKAEGENPRLYWVENNQFSTLKEKAHIFADREEVQKVQDMFPFDMQLENIE